MNRNASPLVKLLMVALFFGIMMLLSGVRLHHDSPQSLTNAQKTAKEVSKLFKQDSRAWGELAEKNPLLMLRLTSRR